MFAYNIQSVPVVQLKELDYNSPILKKLRQEVKHNLKVSKSASSREHLISLIYYKYKVKKNENFFQIMAKTGMDIESISSVNYLSSPYDIYTGMILYIPNMRGVMDREISSNNQAAREKLSKKYFIAEELLQWDSISEEWFVPGRKLGKVEKSFFYSFAFQSPIEDGRMSSNYGIRKDPFSKKKTFHGGIDIAAPKGTSVLASASGEVVFAGKKGGYGNLIVIKHILGYESRYGHLSKIRVKVGALIKKGELIGDVGSTGRSTGPHLHFEVRRFKKKEKPVFQDHG